MPAFGNDNKRALHDVIAGTLVVNKWYDDIFLHPGASKSVDAPSRSSGEAPPPFHDNLPSPMETKSEVVCPKCGMINTYSAIFCACCGDELKENTERFRGPRR